MAAGGGSTVAYRCFLDKGSSPAKLVTVPCSSLRSECLKGEEALTALLNGEFAVVAGSDMAELRELIGGLK